jgi:uncharacterized protein
MYDISRAQSSGFGDSFTEEDRNRILGAIAEQRYAEVEGGGARTNRARSSHRLR